MRSELDASCRGTIEEADLPVGEENCRVKKSGTRSRRSQIVSRILADANRGAQEYAENWNAGRGAE